MKHTAFSFPDWINPFIPDDGLFAQAYQGIKDNERAWLKTSIARLHDWCVPRKDVAGEDLRRWEAGFETRKRFEPVDFAVVLFDDSLLSPARLLAALMPALAGGVRQVLAARVGEGGPWRKAVLTGLELAGQEFVVDLDESRARCLLNDLRETDRPGAVAVLGPKAAVVWTGEQHSASRMAFWRPRFSRMASVWMDDSSTFDLDVLAFMHPDILFSVHGAEVALPTPNFSRVEGGFDDFLAAVGDVAYLPSERMEHALGKAKLVLGPGHEGCWIWPDLHPNLFQFHSTAWTLGD